MISIIVPIFNAEKWLNRCIDSILSQTNTDFELLLIDDGSIDGSGSICEEYADKDSRVRVFHKQNGGASSARNVGLDNAKGEWITFCDADDITFPDWLENYRLEENKDKALVCQGLVKFTQDEDDPDINPLKEFRAESNGNIFDVMTTLFKTGMLGWIPIKAFNGRLLKERKTRFDINQKYREDEKFLFEFIKPEDKLVLYNSVGYYYQVSDENKYNDWQCTPDFSKCIYNNVRRLGFEFGCELRNYFAEEYKTTLLKYFLTEKSKRKELFNDLQKLIKEEYTNIGMFPLTKFMIHHDKTGILSKSILTLHLNLKK